MRSENAAKPIPRAAGYLKDYIERLPKMDAALDYGCGKLRYAVTLAKRSQKLLLVDSEQQLSREQVIAGQRTTVREYAARRWPGVEVIAVEAFAKTRTKVDFALCANVLSAIPSPGARLEAVRQIAAHLKRDGRALFVVQFRNSYFRAWETNPSAVRYRDGWLLDGRGGASFYAIITPDKLERLIRSGSLIPEEVWTEGQMALVLARRR